MDRQTEQQGRGLETNREEQGTRPAGAFDSSGQGQSPEIIGDCVLFAPCAGAAPELPVMAWAPDGFQILGVGLVVFLSLWRIILSFWLKQ